MAIHGSEPLDGTEVQPSGSVTPGGDGRMPKGQSTRALPKGGLLLKEFAEETYKTKHAEAN